MKAKKLFFGAMLFAVSMLFSNCDSYERDFDSHYVYDIVYTGGGSATVNAIIERNLFWGENMFIGSPYENDRDARTWFEMNLTKINNLGRQGVRNVSFIYTCDGINVDFHLESDEFIFD